MFINLKSVEMPSFLQPLWDAVWKRANREELSLLSSEGLFAGWPVAGIWEHGLRKGVSLFPELKSGSLCLNCWYK